MTMPNLIGLFIDDGMDILEEQGITNIIIDWQTMDQLPADNQYKPGGTILSTIPAPNKPIPVQEAIILGVREFDDEPPHNAPIGRPGS